MSKDSIRIQLGSIQKGSHGAKALKKELGQLPGVLSVAVGENHVSVDFDSTGISAGRIGQAVSELGYQAGQTDYEPHIM